MSFLLSVILSLFFTFDDLFWIFNFLCKSIKDFKFLVNFPLPDFSLKKLTALFVDL